MNAKQALKKATKLIEELEYANKLYKQDVVAYNAVIEGTVDGKSICGWCDDRLVCEKAEKGGKGCHDWMLMWNHQQEEDDDDETDSGIVDGGADPDGSGDGAGSGNGNGMGDLQAGRIGKHQITGILPE